MPGCLQHLLPLPAETSRSGGLGSRESLLRQREAPPLELPGTSRGLSPAHPVHPHFVEEEWRPGIQGGSLPGGRGEGERLDEHWGSFRGGLSTSSSIPTALTVTWEAGREKRREQTSKGTAEGGGSQRDLATEQGFKWGREPRVGPTQLPLRPQSCHLSQEVVGHEALGGHCQLCGMLHGAELISPPPHAPRAPIPGSEVRTQLQDFLTSPSSYYRVSQAAQHRMLNSCWLFPSPFSHQRTLSEQPGQQLSKSKWRRGGERRRVTGKGGRGGRRPQDLQSAFQMPALITHMGLAKKNMNPQEGHDLGRCF